VKDDDVCSECGESPEDPAVALEDCAVCGWPICEDCTEEVSEDGPLCWRCAEGDG